MGLAKRRNWEDLCIGDAFRRFLLDIMLWSFCGCFDDTCLGVFLWKTMVGMRRAPCPADRLRDLHMLGGMSAAFPCLMLVCGCFAIPVFCAIRVVEGVL